MGVLRLILVSKSNECNVLILSMLLMTAITLQQSFGVQNTCVYGWLSSDVPKKHHFIQWRQVKNKGEYILQPQKIMMVRNIDLPEAVIFYGTKTLIPSYVKNESDEDAIRRFRVDDLDDVDSDSTVIKARSGLAQFMQECHDIETAVIVLLDSDDDDDDGVGIRQQHATRRNSHVLDAILTDKVSRPCHVFTQTLLPPDPTDLMTILDLIYIQPRPYSGGGSSIGYRSGADPERLVAPQYCVVFTTTVQQTRIARALGMRVISMNMDDHLADAALMNSDYDDNNNVSINLSVDDIATPGSYWLNPPHPRDDDGNQVSDPYDLLKRIFTSKSTVNQNYVYESNNDPGAENYDIDDDNDFRAILADIAPLRGSK